LIEHRVGVLVLDSIAALARNDFHHQDDNSSSIASIGQHHINPNSRAAASSSSSSNTNHLGASSYSSSSSSRANALTAQAAALKRLADTFNLVVLITNQVCIKGGKVGG
jgi:RecA/RadA recombinase